MLFLRNLAFYLAFYSGSLLITTASLASLPFTGLLVRTFRRAHPLAARHRGRIATARLFHTLRACAPRADLAVVAGSSWITWSSTVSTRGCVHVRSRGW